MGPTPVHHRRGEVFLAELGLDHRLDQVPSMSCIWSDHWSAGLGGSDHGLDRTNGRTHGSDGWSMSGSPVCLEWIALAF